MDRIQSGYSSTELWNNALAKNKRDLDILTSIFGEAEVKRMLANPTPGMNRYMDMAKSLLRYSATDWYNYPASFIDGWTKADKEAFVDGYVSEEILADLRGLSDARLNLNNEAELEQFHNKMMEVLRAEDPSSFVGQNFDLDKVIGYLATTILDDVPDDIDVDNEGPSNSEPTKPTSPPPSQPSPQPKSGNVSFESKPTGEAPEMLDVTPRNSQVTSRAATYGKRLQTIDKAIGRAAAAIGDDASQMFPKGTFGKDGKSSNKAAEKARETLNNFCSNFLNAMSAMDDGYSLLSFCWDYVNNIDQYNKGIINKFLGGKNGAFYQAAETLRNLARSAQQQDRNINAFGFQNAAADIARIFAKECEKLPATLEALQESEANKNNPVNKLFNFLGKTKTTSVLSNYRRNISAILQALAGYDRFNKNSLNYKLVANYQKADALSKQTAGEAGFVVGEAWDSFKKLAKDTRKFTARNTYGKQVQFEMTRSRALGWLKTLETAEVSRLNAWDDVRYGFDVNSKERYHFESEEEFERFKAALSDFALGVKEGKNYYEALDTGYGYWAPVNAQTGERATGRPVGIVEDGYYPIEKTYHDEDLKRDVQKNELDFGLDSTGFTQHRARLKGGTLIIDEPQITWERYNRKAQEYNSNAELGADLARLERAGYGDTFTQIVNEAFGKGAVDVVKRAIEIGNGVRVEADASSELLKTIRLNLQQAALMPSFGAMFKQFPSMLNAVGSYLDLDSVLAGFGMFLTSKEARNMANKRGEILLRKLRSADPSVDEALYGSSTAIQRALQKTKLPQISGLGFKFFDTMAVKSVYLASVWETVHKDGISRGDPDFEKAVDAHFIPALLTTQLNESMLSRGLLQSSSNEFLRALGMFGNQPALNYNTMVRAIGEHQAAVNKYGKDSSEAKTTRKALRNTIAGQATASLLIGFAGLLAQLLRHRKKELLDDEGNIDEGKVLARALVSSAEAAAGTVWFGDLLAGIAIDSISAVAKKHTDKDDPKNGFTGFFKAGTKEAWGISLGSIGLVEDSVDDFIDLLNDPTLTKVQKLVGDISQVGGIPFNNIYYIISAMLMYRLDALGENPNNYDYIFKYLDEAAKAAKKEEEKAAKRAAKEAEKNGADILAEASKRK